MDNIIIHLMAHDMRTNVLAVGDVVLFLALLVCILQIPIILHLSILSNAFLAQNQTQLLAWISHGHEHRHPWPHNMSRESMETGNPTDGEQKFGHRLDRIYIILDG